MLSSEDSKLMYAVLCVVYVVVLSSEDNKLTCTDCGMCVVLSSEDSKVVWYMHVVLSSEDNMLMWCTECGIRMLCYLQKIAS